MEMIYSFASTVSFLCNNYFLDKPRGKYCLFMKQFWTFPKFSHICAVVCDENCPNRKFYFNTGL